MAVCRSFLVLAVILSAQTLTGTVRVAAALDMPLRLETMGIVQENRHLQIGPQPASPFEIPVGFVRIDSPGMAAGTGPGRSGAQAPAAGRTVCSEVVPPPAAQGGRYGGKDAQIVPGSDPPVWAGRGAADGATAGPIMVEADTLRVLRCTSGEVMPRKLAEEGYAEPGVFTGDVSLQWHDASGPGAVLELEIPVRQPGRYAVAVRVAKYRTYGIHQFLVGNVALGKPVDMFGNPGQDIVTAFTVELGAVHMVAGVHRLVVRVVGTNPDTIMANYGAGLDWVRLTPVPVPGRGGSGVPNRALDE